MSNSDYDDYFDVYEEPDTWIESPCCFNCNDNIVNKFYAYFTLEKQETYNINPKVVVLYNDKDIYPTYIICDYIWLFSEMHQDDNEVCIVIDCNYIGFNKVQKILFEFNESIAIKDSRCDYTIIDRILTDYASFDVLKNHFIKNDNLSFVGACDYYYILVLPFDNLILEIKVSDYDKNTIIIPSDNVATKKLYNGDIAYIFSIDPELSCANWNHWYLMKSPEIKNHKSINIQLLKNEIIKLGLYSC